MKTRLLRKWLNNTGYYIQNKGNYMAIGGPFIGEIITIDKETYHIRYTYDTWHKNGELLPNEELKFIWFKLCELLENGNLPEVLRGKDTIQNPLPVYTIRDGVLVMSYTDAYGYPNVDDEGYMMYDDTHFQTPEQALAAFMKQQEAAFVTWHKRIEELTQKLEMAQVEFDRCQSYLNSAVGNSSSVVVERERKKGMRFFSRISKHIFR